MPSTLNFETQFSFTRWTDVPGGTEWIGVMLAASTTAPNTANGVAYFYIQGTGWRFLYQNAFIGSGFVNEAPAVGSTWYIKIITTTSSSTTTFKAYYATSPTGTWTQIQTASINNLAVPPFVGVLLQDQSGNYGSTSTGYHLGRLIVQDLAPTTATITGPTGSSGNMNSQSGAFTICLDRQAQYGGLTVSLASTGGVTGYLDTFQATSGANNVTSVTIPAGSSSGSFYLTPAGPPGNRTISCTTSPILTTCVPATYSGVPVSTATGYSVSLYGGLANGGHVNHVATGTISLIGTGTGPWYFNGTITATPGLGEGNLYSPFYVPFYSEAGPKTFTFSPSATGTITFSYTNSASLANPQDGTYTGTSIYFEDQFSGTGSIASHTSNTLPSGAAGETWTTPTGGAIYLDGKGGTYLGSAGAGYSLLGPSPFSALPGQSNAPSSVEFVFTLTRDSEIDGSISQCLLFCDTSGNTWGFGYKDEGASSSVAFYRNGTGPGGLGSATLVIPVGSTYWFKFDIVPGWSGNSGLYFYLYYSVDGVNYVPLSLNAFPTGGVSISSFPAYIWPGIYYSSNVASSTTGTHVGGLFVRDITPNAPNCQVSNAYVCTSGMSAAFFFETISGHTAVKPTVLNTAPAFYQNGTFIGLGEISWVPGTSLCCLIAFPIGTQVNPGDTITVAAPPSWMTCGSGNAAAPLNSYPLTNYTGISVAGTDSLTKTFKPGFNMGPVHDMRAGFVVFKNLRYRMYYAYQTSLTAGGYPATMGSSTYTFDFFDFTYSSSFPGDNTQSPGVAGHFAIGFDDKAYGTANQCNLSIVTDNAAAATVVQMHQYDNPGTNGIGQFYVYQVSQTAGSSVANIPISLQFYMPHWSATNKAPQIANLWIVGPADLQLPASGPLTFDRFSQPFALSNYLLANMGNGVGVLRWMDAILGLGSGGNTNLSEPWECHQLNDFSWNTANYVNYSVPVTTARPLTIANSPYIYGDWFGGPWTSAATLGSAIGTAAQGAEGTIVLSSATAATDPIFYGLLLQINAGQPNAEFMRVRGVASDNQTVTVERGSCGYSFLTGSANDTEAVPGTIAPAHVAGEAITIYNRLAWSSGGSNIYTNFGTASTQVAEFVTASAHGLKAGQNIVISGSLTGVLDTYQNQYSQISLGVIFPTSGTTFVQVGLNGSTSNAATLEATYPLSGCNVSVTLPPGGAPWEVPAIVCSALNCNVHYNLPMLASDSLVYSVARKALQYMVPGRKVYVELCDEPWNGLHAVTNQTTWLGRVQGQGNGYWWYGLRSGQIGNIFRSVFATAGRASEVNMMVNGVNNASSIMQGVTSNNMVVQVYTINTYCFGDMQTNTTGSGAAYVNSFLPQSGSNNPDLVPAICDYVYHNVRYNMTSSTYVSTLAAQNAIMAQYNSYLQTYNATNGTNYPPLQLYGYEGDMAGACPKNVPSNPLYPGSDSQGNTWVSYAVNHDVIYDPVWRIYQKDLYALEQQSGFVDVARYAYSLYWFYNATWNYYSWVGQQAGKGDGSDGKANNRHCRAIQGLQYSKSITTNQDQLNVCVRGQAFNEWMEQSFQSSVSPVHGAVTSQNEAFTVCLNRQVKVILT